MKAVKGTRARMLRRRRTPTELPVGFTFAARTGWVKALEQLLVLLFVFVSLAPLYSMLVTSFQPAGSFTGGGLAPPPNPTFDNYVQVWTRLGFSRMFGNSTILTVVSAVAATLLAAAAAFGLVRYRFRGRAILLAGMIGAIAIPPIVVIIPLFITMTDLGWINQYHSAIIAEIGLLLPFSTFLLYSYMKDLPQEIFDAASVDGAGSIGQFWHVALPMSRSGLLTTGIIAAIFVWNDLLIPLFLWQIDRVQTLMVGLATLGPGRTGVRDKPLLMAGVAITILPLLIVFILTRRAMKRGLSEGSLK